MGKVSNVENPPAKGIFVSAIVVRKGPKLLSPAGH